MPSATRHHIFFAHEGHFHIDLSELRLAVGPQVFVAKTAHDLIVAVKAGDHEKLFEELRGLGQGVEHPRVDAAGNQIIPGAFRRALGQKRRFQVEEPQPVQVTAHGRCGPVAQDQIALQTRPAQVDMTVFEARALSHVHIVFDEERRGLGLIEDLEFSRHHLDGAGGKIRIDHAFGSVPNLAADSQHVLAADGLGLVVRLGSQFGVEHDLGDPLAIAQVDENDAPVVPPPQHPAHENHLAAHIRSAELPAGMGPAHIS